MMRINIIVLSNIKEATPRKALRINQIVIDYKLRNNTHTAILEHSIKVANYIFKLKKRSRRYKTTMIGLCIKDFPIIRCKCNRNRKGVRNRSRNLRKK